MLQAVTEANPDATVLSIDGQRIRDVKAGDVGSIAQSLWERSDPAIRSSVLWKPMAALLGGWCGRGAPHFARRRGRAG